MRIGKEKETIYIEPAEEPSEVPVEPVPEPVAPEPEKVPA